MLYIYSRNIPGQTGCLAANTWYLVLIVSSELFVPPLPLLRIPNTYKKSARYATLALRMGRVHRHRQRSTPQHDPHSGTSSEQTRADTKGSAHPNKLRRVLHVGSVQTQIKKHTHTHILRLKKKHFVKGSAGAQLNTYAKFKISGYTSSWW